MDVWFKTCAAFPEGKVVKSMEDCRELLEAQVTAGNVLFWRSPQDCILKPAYEVPIGYLPHQWVGDYGQACAGEPEMAARVAALKSHGLMGALAVEPDYFREIFKCLQKHYEQLPRLKGPVSEECQPVTVSRLPSGHDSDSEAVGAENIGDPSPSNQIRDLQDESPPADDIIS
jgi:hypothetical protein